MERADLYLKVTVDLDEDEDAERVARELCRQLERSYAVRSAEVSSMTRRE